MTIGFHISKSGKWAVDIRSIENGQILGIILIRKGNLWEPTRAENFKKQFIKEVLNR